MKKNNYQIHFEKELAIIRRNNPNEETIIEMFKKPIKQINKIFSKQGHSGSSASFYSSILSMSIKKILSFQPISSITCSDEEWTKVGKGLYQNKRCGSIFKESKRGKSHYLDAIVWKGEEDYDSFTGTVGGIKSRQLIKLPFTPKTFYIDVKKVRYNRKKHKDFYVDKDNKKYVYKIKDKNQLKAVEEYYNTDFKKLTRRKNVKHGKNK